MDKIGSLKIIVESFEISAFITEAKKDCHSKSYSVCRIQSCSLIIVVCSEKVSQNSNLQ